MFGIEFVVNNCQSPHATGESTGESAGESTGESTGESAGESAGRHLEDLVDPMVEDLHHPQLARVERPTPPLAAHAPSAAVVADSHRVAAVSLRSPASDVLLLWHR